MKPSAIAALIVVLIIAVGGILFIATGDSDDGASQQASNQLDTAGPVVETDTTLPEISADEVAEHASEDDCWTIINDAVYDITSYVPRHPGGDDILRACGTDGSSLFNSRTTSDGEEVGSGGTHSSNAARQLSQLQIGNIN